LADQHQVRQQDLPDYFPAMMSSVRSEHVIKWFHQHLTSFINREVRQSRT